MSRAEQDDAPGQIARFESASDARDFIMAGRAIVTLVSQKTGARFTYRITRADGDQPQRPWFVGLLTGSDNERHYSYFGFIANDHDLSFRYSAGKAKVAQDAASVRAFAWAWRLIPQGVMPEQLEVWHEGRCGKCGRTLTVPDSIASGLGPECAGKLGKRAKRKAKLPMEATWA